jgi:hypothetical protein
MYYDPNDFWTRYDVGMEVERGSGVVPPPPPPPPPVTGSGWPGNDRVKGKGKWQPYGSTSNEQPTTKRNSNGDKKVNAGSIPV